MGSGYSYGFGQLGFDELTLADPPALYNAILNPQISIHYVAATNRIAIEVYKKMRILIFHKTQELSRLSTILDERFDVPMHFTKEPLKFYGERKINLPRSKSLRVAD
jgi:hypothetical protein